MSRARHGTSDFGLRYIPSGHRWSGVDNVWGQKKSGLLGGTRNVTAFGRALSSIPNLNVIRKKVSLISLRHLCQALLPRRLPAIHQQYL